METPVFQLAGNAFMARYGAGEAKCIRESPAEAMTTRLQYFSTVLFGGELFFGIELGDRIVALACCLDNLEPDALTLSYLSVDPEYKNRKLATRLVTAIRDFVKDNGLVALDVSGYSAWGQLYLQHLLRRECVNIELRECGKVVHSAQPSECGVLTV
ncbi:GNAT family N-acetyltransferase [Noviherbaspirillum sp. CPCC 100848]|uniref:GNAT family N-acetyltransferase n=1 Tax=Noviherbaspirillum album TaxID=3080276 RepID=A0ABU6JA49_9BURK|nr:GNAT family N-acetyltransferase [Noviherbaspirillum sp. CPCC 100848]MEC4720527.1 GNAT family N-acetyltransferase [Noviherbaspirillum sp. CPCC 100848]